MGRSEEWGRETCGYVASRLPVAGSTASRLSVAGSAASHLPVAGSGASRLPVAERRRPGRLRLTSCRPLLRHPCPSAAAHARPRHPRPELAAALSCVARTRALSPTPEHAARAPSSPPPSPPIARECCRLWIRGRRCWIWRD
ncbi:Os05g0226101 [Oryza sativa Japonica Group]|uniref:Os05g0226101 protein n=1 Tax=Oryza sativa subsp. japonica TaxID=39947 RepID=A0A0P0WJG5_ORYSJ|nr:Os05g0226101 [Oryza sativa Japonica Group]